MRSLVLTLSLFASLPVAAPAQATDPAQTTTPESSAALVMPTGEGRLIVASPLWSPTVYRLEDSGYRTSALFADHLHDIAMQASIYPSDEGTPEACRDLALTPLLAGLSGHAAVVNQASGLHTSTHGNRLVTMSFTLTTTGINPGSQQNLYAFAAGPQSCAELHLTKSPYTAADAALFQAELDRFHFDPAATPTWQEYSALGSVFFNDRRDFRAAAIFYRHALDSLPLTPETLNARRTLTDQLSIAYAVYGDVKSSYNVNEAAIDIDPGYPFYYYNLACVDAELHNPLDARRHLEFAFARRANALPEEPLPDPVHDHSLLKLSGDKKFWAYVEALSRTLPY